MSTSKLLINSEKGHVPASQRIPPIALPYVSERAKKTLDIVEKFVEEECIPADSVYHQQIGNTPQERFSAHPAIVEELKKKAQALGLWNMFLPKGHFKEGAGFSNLEYGLMAELLGKSRTASEATNCAAPDTGNMEVLAKYGNEAQKRRWLDPLLAGKIRSAFLMTEPQVASSDATNIELNMRLEGDTWVLNGQKWWSSGAGDPRCAIYVVMGKSDPHNADPYKQQSVILVPADTPGITVHRMLSVMGFDDAPHGHGHITFSNVRVPAANMVLGPGRGFEIIQGRLGPGRIHHAMRSIGAAERALEYFLARLNDPRKRPFGQLLSSHGVMLDRVARSRIEIDAARLMVLNAAIRMDLQGAKAALKEIAEAKVLVPTMALTVIDRAMQAFGGAGVCQDTPLASMYANGRTMRIVDGPDEVHILQLGRNENKRGKPLGERIAAQNAKADELFKQAGMTRIDPLSLERSTGKAKL
ncbi:Acyl-CoA dehydrogenase family member 10 [Lasiodiplodia hormozganensis]|uniref:Acyl-CoA dehydrogenase family member 10 n=1 Tax=Lasiodiplodia hormozganensis TaxID=869390 RepID=A0AA40CAJ5_9PEZI|nr:Acyl-CoA dehydrogenase family member 10 [Lasiodiplodia hormozganensis]